MKFLSSALAFGLTFSSLAQASAAKIKNLQVENVDARMSISLVVSDVCPDYPVVFSKVEKISDNAAKVVLEVDGSDECEASREEFRVVLSIDSELELKKLGIDPAQGSIFVQAK